jgi:hypothetical protein
VDGGARLWDDNGVWRRRRQAVSIGGGGRSRSPAGPAGAGAVLALPIVLLVLASHALTGMLLTFIGLDSAAPRQRRLQPLDQTLFAPAVSRPTCRDWRSSQPSSLASRQRRASSRPFAAREARSVTASPAANRGTAVGDDAAQLLRELWN